MEKESDMSAKKILIIDDDAGVRFTLRKLLSRAGYDVLEAPDGRKGMKLFHDDHPDLVITDIIMPEQEGIETIIALKGTTPQARVIAISGGGRLGNQDLLRMAKRVGANAVLCKPFAEAELINTVRETLAA